MDFGKTLSRVQEKRGVRSAELARRLGVSRQAVNYLASRKDAKISTLLDCCEALGVSYQTFMREGVKNGGQ
jgi:transcriptional regulator with XRE-family HTH domain